MECTDIQEKLSAYMEGMISSEEKVLFDEHLKMCRKCNESLAELKKTLEYVRNLDEIEPPPWLTKKVMMSVRSEAEARRGILQRLFYPLHIKLPIEALATIVVAVATIYVFKTIQPEVDLAKAPPAKVTTRNVLQEKEETPALDEAKPLPVKPAEQFMFAEEREIPAGKPREAPKASTRIAKRDKVLPSAGVVKKGELKHEALPYEQRAQVLVEKKNEAINLTINVKDIETAGKEIEEAFIRYGGKIIKKEYFVQRNIIFAELDSKKMEELLEKLKRVGEIKEEAFGLEPREGSIEIRIEIVKRQ
jgi:hypothetical protein